jgi:hypothetical protein
MLSARFMNPTGEEIMTLLKKHLLGLLLTVLGGLLLVHGIVTIQGWETTLGFIVLALGVVLLALKVVRRNTPTPQP